MVDSRVPRSGRLERHGQHRQRGHRSLRWHCRSRVAAAVQALAPRPVLPAVLAGMIGLAALVAPEAAHAAVTVTMQKPLDGDTLASPVTVAATAETDAPGAQVTAWQVFLDGVSVTGTPGPASVLNVRLTMPNGDHEVIVQAWDSTGDSATTTIAMTAGTCTGFTVSLDAPAGGSEPTPVHFTASAASCHRITRFALYADGQRIYDQSGPRSIDTVVDLPAGNHTVLARAWDSTGAASSSRPVPIDVEAPAPAAPAAPAPPAGKPASPPPSAPAPPPAGGSGSSGSSG